MKQPLVMKICPFCGSDADIKQDASKKTLEEALESDVVVNCSHLYCIARHVCATPKEWNTRHI